MAHRCNLHLAFKPPPTLDALGIIAAMKTDEWGLQKFAKGGRWKSVLFICDNAVVNKRIAKLLLAETNHMEKLIFAVSPCQPRYLSNATRWSLGGKFGFGHILSFVHVFGASCNTLVVFFLL